VNVYKDRLNKLIKKGVVERRFGKVSQYGKDDPNEKIYINNF